jgi:GTP cyclohydrolase I
MAAATMTMPIETPAGQAGEAVDDTSQLWLERLGATGPRRDAAVVELHELLLKAARFEVDRRRATLPHLRGGDQEDLAQQSADELVLVRAIPFHSLCMHHMLPFHGLAHIGYLPAERIVGLSKLARVVELFARDLQVQERLTTQVADWVQEQLEPKGVGVVLEAEHLCMSMRGVQKFGATTVTSALHGQVRDDPRTRQEFLALTTKAEA